MFPLCLQPDGWVREVSMGDRDKRRSSTVVFWLSASLVAICYGCHGFNGRISQRVPEVTLCPYASHILQFGHGHCAPSECWDFGAAQLGPSLCRGSMPTSKELLIWQSPVGPLQWAADPRELCGGRGSNRSARPLECREWMHRHSFVDIYIYIYIHNMDVDVGVATPKTVAFLLVPFSRRGTEHAQHSMTQHNIAWRGISLHM